MSRRLAPVLALLLAAAPSAARKPGGASPAPNEQAKKVAKDHFKAAEWLFAQRQYAEAITEYQAAYNAWPVDALYFNIAQCHRNLGHVDEAIEAFEKYLKSPKAETNREEVEELLAALRKKKQEKAGQEVVEAEPTVSRPKHAKPAAPPVAAPVTPEPAETLPPPSSRAPAVAAAPAPPPPAAARAVPLVPATEPAPPPSAAASEGHGKPVYKKAWFWVVAGAAVVGVAVGAGVGAAESQTRLPPAGSLGLVDWR